MLRRACLVTVFVLAGAFDVTAHAATSIEQAVKKQNFSCYDTGYVVNPVGTVWSVLGYKRDQQFSCLSTILELYQKGSATLNPMLEQIQAVPSLDLADLELDPTPLSAAEKTRLHQNLLRLGTDFTHPYPRVSHALLHATTQAQVEAELAPWLAKLYQVSDLERLRDGYAISELLGNAAEVLSRWHDSKPLQQLFTFLMKHRFRAEGTYYGNLNLIVFNDLVTIDGLADQLPPTNADLNDLISKNQENFLTAIVGYNPPTAGEIVLAKYAYKNQLLTYIKGFEEYCPVVLNRMLTPNPDPVWFSLRTSLHCQSLMAAADLHQPGQNLLDTYPANKTAVIDALNFRYGFDYTMTSDPDLLNHLNSYRNKCIGAQDFLAYYKAVSPDNAGMRKLLDAPGCPAIRTALWNHLLSLDASKIQEIISAWANEPQMEGADARELLRLANTHPDAAPALSGFVQRSLGHSKYALQTRLVKIADPAVVARIEQAAQADQNGVINLAWEGMTLELNEAQLQPYQLKLVDELRAATVSKAKQKAVISALMAYNLAGRQKLGAAQTKWADLLKQFGAQSHPDVLTDLFSAKISLDSVLADGGRPPVYNRDSDSVLDIFAYGKSQCNSGTDFMLSEIAYGGGLDSASGQHAIVIFRPMHTLPAEAKGSQILGSESTVAGRGRTFVPVILGTLPRDTQAVLAGDYLLAKVLNSALTNADAIRTQMLQHAEKVLGVHQGPIVSQSQPPPAKFGAQSHVARLAQSIFGFGFENVPSGDQPRTARDAVPLSAGQGEIVSGLTSGPPSLRHPKPQVAADASAGSQVVFMNAPTASISIPYEQLMVYEFLHGADQLVLHGLASADTDLMNTFLGWTQDKWQKATQKSLIHLENKLVDGGLFAGTEHQQDAFCQAAESASFLPPPMDVSAFCPDIKPDWLLLDIGGPTFAQSLERYGIAMDNVEVTFYFDAIEGKLIHIQISRSFGYNSN